MVQWLDRTVGARPGGDLRHVSEAQWAQPLQPALRSQPMVHVNAKAPACSAPGAHHGHEAEGERGADRAAHEREVGGHHRELGRRRGSGAGSTAAGSLARTIT